MVPCEAERSNQSPGDLCLHAGVKTSSSAAKVPSHKSQFPLSILSTGSSVTCQATMGEDGGLVKEGGRAPSPLAGPHMLSHYRDSY